MTETDQPSLSLPPGSYALTMLVREFTRAVLRQPAVADFVRGEHFSNPAAEPPAGIGDALRLAMLEVLGTTTTEDCDQLARYFLAYARECMEDDGTTVVFPSAAPVRDGWAPPRGFLARKGWAPPPGLLRARALIR